jgi:ABC-type phosphate transport system auxiliary subunit
VEDLQRHKFSCLRHAFAAVRLQQARLRLRNSDDDTQNSRGVGDARERQTENPLLNDESASRLAATEMEESWRTWYESRGRKF